MNLTFAVFAKPPVAGRVKTRLCPPLRTDVAAALYAAFVRDTVRQALSVGPLPTIFHAGARAALRRLLAEEDLPAPAWASQGRGDLGARLARVPAPCVIIGTDSPNVPLAYLREAVARVATQDVVLGPAADGGYYLIGLRAPRPELFEGIAWGTDQVLAQTLARAQALGRSVSRLPSWYDVDTIDDLRRLDEDLRAGPAGDCPATRAVLETVTL